MKSCAPSPGWIANQVLKAMQIINDTRNGSTEYKNIRVAS